MQLVLELLKKIFIALQGVYTKPEVDSALAVRDTTIATNTASISRAELIERYRDQTYCELTISKLDGYDTSRLPRIEATGLWYLDLDDGNGAQMRIDDDVQVEFSWGEQTRKTIVIYGNITKIYNEISDVDGDYRYSNVFFFLVSGIIESLSRALVFGGRWQTLKVDISISSKYFSFSGIFGAGPTVDKYANFAQSITAGRDYRLKANIESGESGGLFSNAKSMSFVVDSSSPIPIPVGNAVNGGNFDKLVFSAQTESHIGGGFGNYYSQKNLTYINTALSTTTSSFSALYGMTDFVGTMPNLFDAPSLFNNTIINAASIIGILNKLPTYTDGGTHRIGFTTDKTNTGIAHTDTTETFTVTDDGGTEYSVENCPLFTNDDADYTLRKAYVLAIAKKGWEVLI